MLQGRYYDRTIYNVNWIEGRDIDNNWVASQTIFNMAASYRGEMAGGMQWRAAFNVTNLFDREPSIVANTTGQTMVLGHDNLGRRYQLSLNFDF